MDALGRSGTDVTTHLQPKSLLYTGNLRLPAVVSGQRHARLRLRTAEIKGWPLIDWATKI